MVKAMNRVGIDTNVLLRSVVGDDPVQSPVAKQFLLQQREQGVSIFINRVVLVETIWSLGRTYQFTKKDLCELLEGLIETESIELEDSVAVQEALESYRASNADFSDCLILLRNQAAGVALTMTFDKKAAKLQGFSLLK